MRGNASAKRTDWQACLDEITRDIEPHLGEGKVADYIPALAAADPYAFGIAFTNLDEETFTAGNADQPFSIQSISKVFALVIALGLEGRELWTRVGREPSGTRFNSVVQLEHEQGKPRNPLINAGALVVTDTIVGHCGRETAVDRLLTFLRRRTGNRRIDVNGDVARSEEVYGDRNRALAYFMKSFGVIREDVPAVTHAYFRQCAIEMSVADLSRAGLFLATDGTCPISNERAAAHHHVDRVNSIMMMCGHYDRSGDFAFRVGLAGKSGVGGGIMAIIPGVGCVTVWSPALNEAGNSYAGTLALEMFSNKTELNLF